MWADPAAAGTTLFSEDFSGYSANNVPSGSVTTATGRVVYGGGSVTYTSADNGTNKTMIYTAALASGTSPELLIGKSAGVFTIAGIPSGAAQEITVSFKQNAQKLTVSLSGTGYSTTYTSPKPTAAGTVSFDITVADGADATFTLIMSAGSSNVRVDDILVTVKTAGEGGGDTPPTPAKTLESVAVSGNPTKTSYTAGENFDPAGLTVTGIYSDESTAPITSGITWAYNPSQTLAEYQTSIGVTATVNSIASAEYPVSITVAAAPAPTDNSYEKVTSAPEDWSGEYLLVYENGNNAHVWTGADAANCYVSATISNNVIAKPEGAVTLTIAKEGTGYSLLINGGANNGKYLTDNANNAALKFATTAYAATFSYESNWTKILFSQRCIRFNNGTNSGMRFRYYAATSQQPIQLYKKATASLPSAELTFADASHLVKLGDAFTAPELTNPHSVAVTYASSNTNVAEVASNGAVTIKALGVAVITASFAGNDDYKAGSASYTICVVNHLGAEADPFDVADARRVIDAFGTKEGVYMAGIVSQITTPYDETYHNISFDISTDGTPTADQVRAYRCKGLDNIDFTSEDDVKTGATVTVYGDLKKYNSTYEFDAGCYLKAYEAPAVPKTHIANAKETAYTVAQALTYAADGATYDLDDYVYISGVVYDVQNFNNGKLSIFIKDADAENQFELYNCAGINDGSATTPFESINDVKVGNVVIGYGQMMYYQQGDIYEFKAGNYLAELQKPITGVWISELSAEVEAGATYTLTANVLPANATGTIDWTVESGAAYASVADGVVTGIAEGVAVIRATAHGTEFYKECTVTVTIPAPDTRFVANGSDFEAISGDLTPADIKFAAYKGDGTTNPQINNKNIRIYKPASGKTTGGYLKLTALMGFKIDQVEITFDGNAKASYAIDDAEFSTVAYIDGEETLLTPTGLDAQSVSIVNLKNGSIDVKAIKVWYTGAALPIHHYFLGGTYQTEFVQYGAFNYDGLKVYAAYDELETIKEEIFDFTVQANLMTYGEKKAEVYRNSNKIAEYDITVTESPKQNPALAYEPKYDEITLGDAWTAPAFSNPLNVVGITFSSNKTSVAKVTNEGVITLEGGCGTAVITAHFAETEEYVESTATYTIIVNEPAEDLSGTWVVATSVEVGDRIIIADVAVAGEVKTMGLQNSSNRAAVASTVSDLGVLTPAEGTKTFLVVATETEGEYALKALNGYYLYAASKSSNQLKEEASIDADGNANWTIKFENGIATIKAQGKNTNNWIRYNGQNNVFSCYGATNNQADVVIYKHGAAPEPPTPVYETVRGSLTAGNYYTLCFNKTMTAIQGASLWSFAGKDANMAYIVEAEAPYAAGTPYLIYAESDKLEALTEEVANPVAGSNNGLYGTFSYMSSADLDEVGATHMLKNNEIRPLGVNNHLDANRAYIILSEILNPAPANAPGKRVRAIPMHKDVVTGFENIDATEKPVKLMLNGQIYILRGEKLYDATGRLVK